MDEEIKENKEQLWGSITGKIDRIENEADRLHWGEVINMVVGIFDEADEMEPLELFLSFYQFLFRLYYRLKAMNEPEPFNQISRTTKLENHDDREYYMVKNYDYKMFKWATRKGYADSMTNGWFLVPVDKLSAAEKHNFERKLNEGK